MKKQFKWAYLWIGFALLAIGIMIWQGCQKQEPEPVINVPTLTPPGSVTSEPSQVELDILEREKQRRLDYPTDSTDED